MEAQTQLKAACSNQGSRITRIAGEACDVQSHAPPETAQPDKISPGTGAMALAVSPILLAVPRAQGQARRMRMAEVPHSVLVSSALSTHNPGI